MAPTVDVRRADTRFHTHISWLDSWHSFSFAEHYDPDNTHHGLLLVFNDDVIAPSGAFATHPHRDMEIVTWVLEGTLEHRDSEGNVGTIIRNTAQRMSAGTGIRHSESNASSTGPLHLLQMWVPPDTRVCNLPTSSETSWPTSSPTRCSRSHPAGSQMLQSRSISANATLWIARLTPGTAITMPDAPFVDVFIAQGAATLEGAGHLAVGDAARLTDAGSLRLTADADDTEAVIWETWSDLQLT